ncbi:MAG: metal ABC transporter permease [Treponema sp.]|jgi:zinc transport system permease protein|nr:metal ABC transporter permease [Treponema sp.]
MGIADAVIGMFSFAFIVRAFIVGILVSLCASLLGVSLVLKRYSMIGDGLSHVGFGSLAVATAFNMAPLTVSIPVVVAAAFLLLRLSENSKIKGDAAIALFSTGALAIGVMVISMTTGMNTDVCNYLFGSILAMSKADVRLSVGLSVSVIVLFVFFYNKIFAVTFDETFAKASGVPAGLYNTIIAVLTAVTIVLGMRMMGALLISSLIIFPALSSMRFFKSFKHVTVSSAVISVSCFFSGIVVSYAFATPTGASVVIFNMAVFAVFSGISAMRGKFRPLAAAALVVVLGSCAKGPVLTTPKNTAGTRAVQLPAELLPPAAPEGGAESGAEGGPAAESALFAESGLSGSSGGNPAAAGETGQVNFAAELGFGPPARAGQTAKPSGPVVEIKEKMFIAQTNDIYLNAEDYIGKTIRLEGLFKTDSYDDLSKTYCFVMRYGPGCCGNDGSAGFEVAWPDEQKRPYPKEDSWVRAEGTLRYYEEDSYPYLYLALASLTVEQNRGAEFVTQ